MKTILCQVNSQYIHSALAPWCLAAAARERCADPGELQVVDANINQPVRQTAARLAEGRPGLVALSCYIWNAAYLQALFPLLRALLPDAVIAVGGPEASFDTAAFLEANPAVDCVLTGEGETTFPLFLDALASGASWAGVPGLVCRRGGQITSSPPPPPAAQLPDPYTPAYFAALAGRIAYVETSRGCPFTCAFCLSGREDRLRQFPLPEMERRLLKLSASGSKTIKFVDRTFNADEKRAMEIWRFLIRRRLDGAVPAGVCFHFEVGADLFSDACLAFLKTAPPGLFQFEAGLQSFNPETLGAVQRRTDLSRLCANLLSIRAGGNIHLHVDLIAGLPYEDAASFAASFDRAFALRPHQLQLGFLKLLRGSALRARAAQLGLQYDPAPPYEVRATRWLQPASFHRIKTAERALGWLYNSGRYPRALAELLGLWQGGAFAFFAAFGSFAAARGAGEHPAQDAVAELLFQFGGGLAGMAPQRLRDLLCLDLLSGRRGGRLPGFLRAEDPDHGRIAPMLRSGAADHGALPVDRPGEKFHAGQLGFCILYSGAGCCSGGRALAVADYTRRDPVTGRYALKTLPVEEFFAAAGHAPPRAAEKNGR